MARTLSDLRTLVKENIKSDSSVTDARIDSWINLAQDDVERRFLGRHISALGTPFATVADTAEYTLVITDFRAFVQFWQTDSPTKLGFMNYEDFVRLEPDPDSSTSGKPRIWMFVRFTSGFPTIRLHPIPDAAYTINFEYLLNLADLSNDNDVSLISELGWDSLLLNGATHRYYKIHSLEDSLLWGREFENDLLQFKREFTTDVTTRRVMVDILKDSDLQVSSLLRLPENFPL